MQGQQAGLVDLATGAGDHFRHAAQLVHRLAEGNALAGAAAHGFQCALGDTDAAHAVVNAARAKATLGDFEAATFTQQDVGNRDAHIVVFDFGMTVRGVVVTEHVQVANDLHAGGVQRHQNHALLQVLRRVGVGLAHDDGDLAVFVHRSGGPPLGAVDDVFVTFAADLALDVGGIGGGDIRLGHGEAGADFTGQQRLEPLLFLLVVAVAFDGFHVAGVRRVAVEDFAGEGDAAHDFTQVGVLFVGQAGATLGLGQEQVPQTLRTGLFLELFQDGRVAPLVLFYLLVEHGFVGVNVLIHEALELGFQILDAGAEVKHVESFGGGSWVCAVMLLTI